jgi:S-ribosylhomocysteine lyase LuxS involved in autoinducer biosynthesis
MATLKEKVNELNNLITTGNTVKAMELFYADDVEMQENNELPRKGKLFCINHEKENLQKVKNFVGKLLNQAIDNTNEIVFSEWEI